jgi:hypothetical protein
MGSVIFSAVRNVRVGAVIAAIGSTLLRSAGKISPMQ